MITIKHRKILAPILWNQIKLVYVAFRQSNMHRTLAADIQEGKKLPLHNKTEKPRTYCPNIYTEQSTEKKKKLTNH